jgi:hypothetical protein
MFPHGFEDTMSKLTRIATPLIAVAIMSSVPFMTLAQNSPKGNATQSSTTTQDWKTPPPGNVQTQKGYRDGVESAMLDALVKRKMGATTSWHYLHPPVKAAWQYEYRAGYVAGYAAQLDHAGTTSSGSN